MTLVIHHRDAGGYADVVDIGRGSGLLGQGGWGNPYSHRPSRLEGVTACKTREDAIEAYRLLLWQLVQLDRVQHGALIESLAALEGRTLACWCKPQACHGDVLARAAAWAHKEMRA
jgi:hypothetical protein